MSASVPIKLLHEGQGHPVTIELKSGDVYKGMLDMAEDNMNCHLSDVAATAPDGRVARLAHVYLRGSQIKMVVLPDLLKKAPMFAKVQQMRESATDRDWVSAAMKRGGRRK